jgi:hypothetical protein
MTAPSLPDALDDLPLLRAFEPVVRLTRGEFFLPVGVENYVENSALWASGPDGPPVMLAEPGTLDLTSLAAHGSAVDGPGQSLSGITVPTSRWARIRGARTRRPRFRGSSRLAQVGLLGRSIDTLSRFSLLLRGTVPGGSAALSLSLQNEHLAPDRPAYHARVVRDSGWIVCQYWFFYAFNNWRSGFSGVNEHEADWEQVTIYLDGSGALDHDGLPPARWVVFSAHDETGDDLRRRWDDPDLSLVDDRHTVVFAGAGSHSGAYLAGDYLITVAPPSLGGIVPAVRRLAKLLTPWSRAAQGTGLEIPYVDYARGDGLAVGPGEDLTWTPVVIGDDTPWVRDFRGLWGHDTRDMLGVSGAPPVHGMSGTAQSGRRGGIPSAGRGWRRWLRTLGRSRCSSRGASRRWSVSSSSLAQTSPTPASRWRCARRDFSRVPRPCGGSRRRRPGARLRGWRPCGLPTSASACWAHSATVYRSPIRTPT